MPPLGSSEDLTDAQKASVRKVKDRFNSADKLHRQLTPRWNCWYGLSRNWRRLQRAHAQAATPNDKDSVLQEFKRVMGDDLFIPYVFTVIETNLPRIMSTAPQVRVLPNDEEEQTLAACKPVKQLFERDHEVSQYELKLQEVARSGLRYGLGVGKRYWEKRTRSGKEIKARRLGLGKKVVDGEITIYEGPQFEAVDIFDFFWDPAAKSMETASYVIHRTWRDMEYIARKVKSGEWADLDLEKVKGMGSASGRGETWEERMNAAGMSDSQIGGNNLHEVWEYHDRDKVITVLDRELPVQEDVNPFLHGEFPFQIFRPTLVEHEFVGIGEAEPIAHLSWELNTMRGQRRDAATLALNRGYFYQQGTLDPTKLVTGAGAFNPVFGNPSEIIQPMPFSDIPQSGVSEEEALKSDIELASAMSEATVGSGGEDTATGTQLVQAAANLRVRQKSRNLHLELLVPDTAQQHSLYEQHITGDKQARTMRVEGRDGFEFVKCGPEEIAANIEVSPVDGSTEPDNPAQKRSDATDLAAALAPFMEVIDPSKFVKHVLTQFGVEKPDDWVSQRQPEGGGDPEQLIVALGHYLVQHGVDPKLIGAGIEQVAQAQPSEEQAAPEFAAPQPAGG